MYFSPYCIYCDMQFADVANESNMRIAIAPEENKKSEPFSNRKQVRIFLVWWARVDSNKSSYYLCKFSAEKSTEIMRFF